VKFIKEYVSSENSKRLLFTDPEFERDEVLNTHQSSTEPTVLISLSFNTGIDLHDDLSRFQVITKVPFPSLSDRWISMKRENYIEWYYWQTALKLVQAYGRSIRSKDDWAKTYVLDSHFEEFVRRNKKILPEWFASGCSKLSELLLNLIFDK
jgi:ATP-dependent DNA helicase DinG